MEKVLEKINKLREGHKLTEEDINDIERVVNQLEEAEENYEKVQEEKVELEQELSYYHQKDINDSIQMYDEWEQEDREQLEELNRMYEDDFGGMF